jgi:hypothetical protein
VAERSKAVSSWGCGFEFRRGALIFVLCVVNKVKWQIQYNQEKERITDEVKTEYKRIPKKIPPFH